MPSPVRALLAAVGLLAAASAAAAETPADTLTRLLGPLAPQGLTGRAGDWEMAVADDAYVLANRAGPYGARFMSMVPPAGPLQLSATVRLEAGNAPADALVGGGLLFDLHGTGAARRYALLLVERTGEIGIYRGDAAGLKREAGMRLPAATGFVRLSLAEANGKLVATANGVRVAETARDRATAARAGIAAVGPGRFAFRDVRMATTAPPVAAATERHLGRLVLSAPPGWVVEQRPDGLATAAGDGIRVAWWPFRRTGGMSPEAGRALRAALVEKAVPGTTAGPAEAAADGQIAGPLVADGRVAGHAVLRWAAAGDGLEGLFAAATAADWTPSAAAAAAAVLRSVRIAGAPPAAAAAPRTRRWSDPAGGFSAEVPQGWTVEGGTRIGRDGAPAWHLAATSPEGVRIFLGDPELPLFLLPTERLKAAGFQEGATFRHADGTPVLVARHMPGLGYAEVHGMRILAGRCAGDPMATYRRRRADLEQPLEQGLMPVPSTVGLEVGEVAMSCTGRDGRLSTYVLAATDGDPGSGREAWSVQVVMGFVAPEPEARAAVRALASLVASLAPSPLAAAGRDENPARRTAAAAAVAAAVGRSWWAEHGPDAAAVATIAAPGDGPDRPVQGGAGMPWLAAGADPAAGIAWDRLLAGAPAGR